MIEVSVARLCRECNAVTGSDSCPVCCGKTVKHPSRNTVQGYCVACAGGPFPAAELTVRTFEDDPYEQCDDGTLITGCAECMKKYQEDEDE